MIRRNTINTIRLNTQERLQPDTLLKILTQDDYLLPEQQSAIMNAVSIRMSEESDPWDYNLDRMLHSISILLHGDAEANAKELAAQVDMHKARNHSRIESLAKCSGILIDALKDVESAKDLLAIAKNELSDNLVFSPTLAAQALEIARRQAKVKANDHYIDVEMAVLGHVVPTSNMLQPIASTIATQIDENQTNDAYHMLDTLRAALSHGRAALRETQMAKVLATTDWKPADEWHDRILATIDNDAKRLMPLMARIAKLLPDQTHDKTCAIMPTSSEEFSHEATNMWLDARFGMNGIYDMCHAVLNHAAA
jgi:hypothetical protein